MPNNSNNLYFIDSIMSSDEERFQVTLIGIDEYETKSKIVEVNQNQLRMNNHSGKIKEGWYIYYDDTNQQLPFSYGNLHAYARKQFVINNTLRKQLIDRLQENNSEDDEWLNNGSIDIYSYHINVGHGNCSLLLIMNEKKYSLWMVDCSKQEIRGKSYRGNIEDCLRSIAIKVRVNVNTLHIDKFFLTHAHFDHYNGMKFLLDKNLINGSSTCYINLYYQVASDTMNDILNTLKQKQVRIIEPVPYLVNSKCISILHPECRLYKSRWGGGYSSVHSRIVSKINNSSVVFRFAFGSKSMVFTGDLEKEGFNQMTKSASCRFFLRGINYYAVSHHGSINGHPNIVCLNHNNTNYSPITCITKGLCKSIIMGRDGAYNGVYSSQVINHFLRCSNLLFTEKDANGNPIKYFEIDWKNDNVTYY